MSTQSMWKETVPIQIWALVKSSLGFLYCRAQLETADPKFVSGLTDQNVLVYSIIMKDVLKANIAL